MRRPAFTLVELLVAISVISILMALTLCAVQFARESARRTQCKNNLHQLGMGLQGFHATQNRFPAGRDATKNYHTSWITHLLPYLEEHARFAEYDFNQPWNDSLASRNAQISETQLAFTRCPTSPFTRPGETDYIGIKGSGLSGIPLGDLPGHSGTTGILVAHTAWYAEQITFGNVTDGTSHTIAIAESADQTDIIGRWASGWNAIAQENAGVNQQLQLGIRSFHHQVAYAAMADGSVQTLTQQMSTYLLGSLCTRSEGETVAW